MDIRKVLYEREYSSWRELELEIEKIPITVEKGNAFEQVCFYYLMYNKDLYQIDYIYTNKIPGHEIPPAIISTLHMNPNIDDGVDESIHQWVEDLPHIRQNLDQCVDLLQVMN